MAQSHVDLLLKQYDANWANDEWIVPMRRALDGVTAKEAAWKPPGGANSIRQLVNHLNFFNELTLRRLQGEDPPFEAESNTATFGEPGDPNDEQGWEAAKERAFQLRDGIRARIADLSDDELPKPIGDSTLGGLLSTWLMHDAYHGGQIVVLRKIRDTWPKTIWP